MKDFLFIYRAEPMTETPSPEELQAITTKWIDWIGSIGAQNRLAARGNSLQATGKVVRNNNMVTDGPFTEIKETIGGYSIVKADSLDEAVKLTEGCPGFLNGGSVEVREINMM